jgi:hypothetical protein
MPSTGNAFPQTGENNAADGVTAWTNPGNCTVDDATDAVCVAAVSGQWLVARRYLFSIPATATILGITVRIEASEHSAGTETLAAQLQNDAGTLFGASKNATITGTGKTVYTYGSASDLWSAVITPTIANDDDFGVRFRFNTAHEIQVDYVTLAVEYQLTGVPGTMLRSGGVVATV